MTEAARELLTAFDALSPEEQHQVATEVLRRTAGSGDLPDAALHQLADELFRGYDAEEAARAGTSPG
jgi:hypothetical protein